MIVGIGVGQAAADGEALVIVGERAGAVAGIALHIADAVEADGEVALPRQIVGVGGDQLADEGDAFLIGGERLLLVAGVEHGVADAAQARRHVALQIGVAGVGGGELRRMARLSW